MTDVGNRFPIGQPFGAYLESSIVGRKVVKTRPTQIRPKTNVFITCTSAKEHPLLYFLQTRLTQREKRY